MLCILDIHPKRWLTWAQDVELEISDTVSEMDSIFGSG